jgi:hypothetical protein
MQPHAHIAQTLERAWGHKDLAALGSILADQLNWYESPLGTPLTTRPAVIERWQHDLATQTDLDVHVTLLDAIENRGYHHCTATWRDTNTGAHTFDGLFKVELSPDGRITTFTQWTAAH